jgi:Cu+-exporting ATPase
MESSGIVLPSSDLTGVATALALSRQTLRTIRQNLGFAFVYNLLGVPLAAGVFYPLWHHLLDPMFASAAMALSSVSVVTNSLRLRRFQPPLPKSPQPKPLPRQTGPSPLSDGPELVTIDLGPLSRS